MSRSFDVREYRDTDADSWLRCRLLSFFYTNYYDDIVTARSEYEHPSIRSVAVESGDADSDGDVVGLMDTTFDGTNATIEVLAVHPDHARRGIGTALLHRCLADPRFTDAGVETLDAWTREDEPANKWYLANGFVEEFSYLHVHVDVTDDTTGFESPDGLTKPLRALVHASRDREAELRQRFGRVYVCRRYVRTIRDS